MATIIGSGLESYLHQQAREKALNRIAEAQEEADRILQQAEEQGNPSPRVGARSPGSQTNCHP